MISFSIHGSRENSGVITLTWKEFTRGSVMSIESTKLHFKRCPTAIHPSFLPARHPLLGLPLPSLAVTSVKKSVSSGRRGAANERCPNQKEKMSRKLFL